MTSWAAAGSPIRYYQCPFCARTHSSLYDEVFARGAGARRVASPVRAAEPTGLPMASSDDIRWAGVKARAARWFARLEAEEHHAAARVRPPAPRQAPSRTALATLAAAPRPARSR
jgi:hypothetical protein